MATKEKKKSKKNTKPSPSKKQIKILITFACIFIIGLLVFHFSSSEKPSHELINLNKSVAYGIDVSYHNGKTDWKKVKSEVDFAFIRLGYRGYDDGEIHLDSKAYSNLKGANKNGVPIGVYFYSQAITEEEAALEAKFVLSKIKDYDISLPVVIDFEYPFSKGKPTGRLNSAGLTKKENTEIINSFCKVVKDAGYTPAVYASSYFLTSIINAKKLDDSVMIWVADYNDNVTYKGNYDFWQFSDKGKCKGVSSKYVDTDYWYTTKNQNNN